MAWLLTIMLEKKNKNKKHEIWHVFKVMEQAIPATGKVHVVATYKLDWLTLPEPSLDSIIVFL